jgi:hypothetical protein
MTENNETTGKSLEISERGSKGVAGPSREVSKRDENVPLPEDTMPENQELEWARRHIPEEPVPRTAEEMLRKRIRTIIDLQDRMQEEMFLQHNSLRHRIEDIEYQVAVLKGLGRS